MRASKRETAITAASMMPQRPFANRQKLPLLLIGRPGVHKALLYHPGWKVHLEGTYGPRGTLQHSMRMRVCVYYALLHAFAGRGQQQQHTVRLTYILHVF